jgi:hypothetical protein
MSLEIFARQSVATFMHIYAEVYTGEAIKPEELEAIIWGRLCAKEAGISQMSIKMPYDNVRRSKVTLPYMPEHINYTGCPVIKKNGGLYTPCCTKVEKEALYCKTCMADKEGKSKMEFGLLDDREQNIEDGNFAPITYAEWMKGHKTTLPEVYAKLAAQGIQIEIPAEELICRTLPKNRRGRKSKPDGDEADTVKPKRNAKVPEADSSSEDEAPKPVPKKPPAKPSHKASPVPSPVASPEASDSDSSEDEAPVRGTSLDKAKPSPVASPAASDSEKPKAKVAPKAVPKKAAASPASSDSDSKAGPAVRPPKEVKAPKEAKEVKAKAEKPAKAKAEKEPKADKAPKAAKASKTEKKKAEPATAEEKPEEFEEEFERKDGDKVVDAGDGQDYIQRNEILFTMDGRIVGRVVTGDDGEDEVEWTDGRE